MVDDSSGYADKHAKFYDVQMDAVERGDVPFYVETAVDADGPVLELACGTGRIYLEALERGVDIDGLDASESTLAVLRENAADRGLEPSVWTGDMGAFDVDREYDLVICPFNAMQHLVTIADQQAALECIHDALADGGQFVFDVFVPSFDVICENYGEWTTDEVNYQGTTHEHRSRTRLVDEVEQIFVTETELLDADGERVFESTQRLNLLPKRELELLARRSPFADWQCTGDFESRPIEDGDSVQVWTLTK